MTLPAQLEIKRHYHRLSDQETEEIAEAGGVAMPEKITVRSVAGEEYDRIVGYKLGSVPEPAPALPEDNLEEVPF